MEDERKRVHDVQIVTNNGSTAQIYEASKKLRDSQIDWQPETVTGPKRTAKPKTSPKSPKLQSGQRLKIEDSPIDPIQAVVADATFRPEDLSIIKAPVAIPSPATIEETVIVEKPLPTFASVAEDLTFFSSINLADEDYDANELENLRFEIVPESDKTIADSIEPVVSENPTELIELLSIASLIHPEATEHSESIESDIPATIAIEIVEILPRLEDDETAYVLETLSKLLKIVNDISYLHEAKIGADDIEIELRELCIELLDKLEIVYDHESLEQFINYLFMIDQLELTGNASGRKEIFSAFHADHGTHETKHFRGLIGYGNNAHYQLHYILGLFVLKSIKQPQF